MAESHPLTFTNAQRCILAMLGDTVRYAISARRDDMKTRAIACARYYILGATGLDCQDDREIERVLAAIWDGLPVDHINI